MSNKARAAAAAGPAFTRRGFLAATLAAGVVIAVEASSVAANAAAGDVTLTASGIKVVGSVGGGISVYDASGKLRQYGSKFQTKDSALGAQLTVGGTPSLVTLDTGPAIRMDYALPAAAAAQTVYALIGVSSRHMHVEWHVTGPSTLVPEGFMFSRAIQAPVEPEEFIALSRWVADDAGGVPYEVSAGIGLANSWDDQHSLLIVDRSRRDWNNLSWVHAPADPGSAGDLVTAADFYFTDTRPNATASIGTGHAIGVEVWTDRAYNRFEPGEEATISFQLANGTTTDSSLAVSWFVRDYDGTDLVLGSELVPVPAAGAVERSFVVIVPDYGVLTTQVTATTNTDSALARTNIAVLPAVANALGAASFFGMANAAWLVKPSADDLLALWQRVGVSRVRISYDGGPGLPPSDFDARGIAHDIELQPDLTVSGPAATAWASSTVDKAVAAGAEYFEVGNELNKPLQSGQTATAYVENALRPVFERRAQISAPIKIMGMALAGPDMAWMENFHAAGGWDLVDAVGLHAGRGNFTPDYIPPGEPATWSTSSNGSYWNFLGCLRAFKTQTASYPARELWMTEGYATTRPNYWWSDTYRHAAENVLLTLAIAKAEGVRGMLWYQFFDSIPNRDQVANPSHAEYHYGLLNRDLSIKPSLFAYATAVRLLDGATFVRWLTFGDDMTKGLLFSTDDGPLAIVWNRSDGYLLNMERPHDGPNWAQPEVWEDPWATKLTLTVSAESAVTVVDPLGRQSIVAAQNGTADITIDGAPRILLGAEFDAGAPAASGPLSVRTRLVNDEVGIAVHVLNDAASPADIRITSEYGSEKHSSVAPGQACYSYFTTQGGAVVHGEVTAAVYHWNGGTPDHTTHTARYGAFPASAVLA